MYIWLQNKTDNNSEKFENLRKSEKLIQRTLNAASAFMEDRSSGKRIETQTECFPRI